MDILEKAAKLKKHLQRIEQEQSRAQGALDHILQTLKSEFGCDSVEEAEALLKDKQQQAKKLEVTLGKRIKKLEEALATTGEDP